MALRIQLRFLCSLLVCSPASFSPAWAWIYLIATEERWNLIWDIENNIWGKHSGRVSPPQLTLNKNIYLLHFFCLWILVFFGLSEKDIPKANCQKSGQLVYPSLERDNIDVRAHASALNGPESKTQLLVTLANLLTSLSLFPLLKMGVVPPGLFWVLNMAMIQIELPAQWLAHNDCSPSGCPHCYLWLLKCSSYVFGLWLVSQSCLPFWENSVVASPHPTCEVLL